jgi:diguanylate cyclase (GGDEF)-like protein
MKDIRKRSSLLLISGTAFIFVLIIVLSLVIPTENLKLGHGKVVELTSGWLVTDPDGKSIQTDLPVRIAAPQNQPYLAEYTFDRNYNEGSTLRIRASMQAVRVLIDGEQVFESDKPESDFLTVPEASVWYFVKLPNQLEGKTLTLQLASSTKAFSGTINQVTIGRADSLFIDLLNHNWINISVVVFLLAFGLFSIAASFIFRMLNDHRLLNLGLFAIAVGLWLFSEAKLLQFVTGNRFILGGLSYVLIALLPVPFLNYLRDAVIPRHRRLLAVISGLFMLLFFVILILQFSGIAPFIESAAITNSLTLAVLICVIALIIREAVSFRSRPARNFLLYSSVLVLSVAIEIINFLNQNYNETSAYGRIGIIIFFIFLAGSSVLSVNKLLDADKEAKLLRKLAYIDVLTGASNRLAFERDLDLKAAENNLKSFRLIMMDINNLKSINDRHGHKSGDQAIRLCYDTMSEILENSGVCYRIGGDEFACILNTTDPARYQRILARVRKTLADIERELPYKLELAIGSDVFVPDEGVRLEGFIHHVDQLMYENKRLLKEIK